MVKMVKNARNLEKLYNKHLIKNSIVSNIIIAVIVLYIIGVSVSPSELLNIFNNQIFRIVSIIIICLVCLVDPIKAILLAIAFVVSIQKIKQFKTRDLSALNNINIDELINDEQASNELNKMKLV